MRIRCSALHAILILSYFLSSGCYAQSNSVTYHCPNIDDISSNEIRTDFNNKSISWKINNSFDAINDSAIAFTQASLKRKDNESYDMSVTCLYKTKNNKMLSLSPSPNFYHSIDGLSEKSLGAYWKKINSDTLDCQKSAKDCGFLIR